MQNKEANSLLSLLGVLTKAGSHFASQNKEESMKEFFTTTIGAWDDGSVRLTTPGIIAVVIVIALLVVIAAVVRHRKEKKKAVLTTKQLVYSAVAIALAVVCSMIKFANLPMGGSITLFSMLFIALIGYWDGPYVGIMTAVAY